MSNPIKFKAGIDRQPRSDRQNYAPIITACCVLFTPKPEPEPEPEPDDDDIMMMVIGYFN